MATTQEFHLVAVAERRASESRLRLVDWSVYSMPQGKENRDQWFVVALGYLWLFLFAYWGFCPTNSQMSISILWPFLFGVFVLLAGIAKRFIIYGPEPQRIPVFSKDSLSENNKRLFRAVVAGNEEEVASLVRKGADPNAVGQYDEGLRQRLLGFGDQTIPQRYYCIGPAIFAAVSGNNPQMLRLLLENGASLGLRDIAGLTVLHIAAEKGEQEILRAILAHMEEMLVRERRNRFCWEFLRCFRGVPEYLRVNDLANFCGWSPLMFAISEGNAALVKILLAHGADPGLNNPRQRPVDPKNPLDFAMREGTKEIQELIQAAVSRGKVAA